MFALFALAASSDTFLLLKAKEIGIAAAWLPVLWAFSNGVKSLFSTWGGGLSDRFGRRRLLFGAWTLYAACYAGFAFVSSAGPLVALVGVYSLYYSLSEGTERALVADLVEPSVRGRAFGWMNGLVGFAALPASVVFGLVWQGAGSRTAFLAGAAVAGAAVLGARRAGSSGAAGRVRSPACQDPCGSASTRKAPATPAARPATSATPSAPSSISRSGPTRPTARPATPATGGRTDELDPDAVDHMQAPRTLSRPNSDQRRRVILERFAGSPLLPIAEKVAEGTRLSFEDGVALFTSPDVLGVGALANLVREKRHGNTGYYNVNRYLNPTNLCWVDCALCAWARKPGVDGGYTMSIEEAVREAAAGWHDGITELHIVGRPAPVAPLLVVPRPPPRAQGEVPRRPPQGLDDGRGGLDRARREEGRRRPSSAS